MLSMDDIKYIKRMYEKEDCSIREIMRRTGYHYETVKKYLDMEDFNNLPHPPREVPSLLDPLKPVIDEWLQADLKLPRKQRHTAKKVFENLMKKYPQLLKVKRRTVQYYVSKKKLELAELDKQARLPLYHPTGGAQVDFGHVSVYNRNGILIDVFKLTMSFPYSNKSYCQVFGGENQQCLLQGMKNIFMYMGKVPTRIVFDNLSTAVAHMGRGHDRVLTDGFKRFLLHYGFEAVFCNGNAGWEKGNVENKVGYERRNMFVPVPTVKDFSDFNKELFTVCDKDALRPHYIKHCQIEGLFQEELPQMNPLPRTEFDVFMLETRMCDNYAKIHFDGNTYSTAPKFAKAEVFVKATSDAVFILDGECRQVISHPRLYGKGLESMNWLPYLELMSRRPMAIKYTDFFNTLPENWRKYLASQDLVGRRKGLTALHEMLKQHDMDTAETALSVAIDNGVKDADSILAAYRALTAPTHNMAPMQLKCNIVQQPKFTIDNTKYDRLFAREVHNS